MSWGLKELKKPKVMLKRTETNSLEASTDNLELGRLPITAEYSGLAEVSYYEPPQNIAGNMVIPITGSSQPVALVTVKVKNNSLVVLKATIGWRIPANNGFDKRLAVMFQIWRESVDTGQLICSIIDSGAAGDDCYLATSFEHVDSQVPTNSERDRITYILTARQLNQPEVTAEISGCLTFSALCLKAQEQR